MFHANKKPRNQFMLKPSIYAGFWHFDETPKTLIKPSPMDRSRTMSHIAYNLTKNCGTLRWNPRTFKQISRDTLKAITFTAKKFHMKRYRQQKILSAKPFFIGNLLFADKRSIGKFIGKNFSIGNFTILIGNSYRQEYFYRQEFLPIRIRLLFHVG